MREIGRERVSVWAKERAEGGGERWSSTKTKRWRYRQSFKNTTTYFGVIHADINPMKQINVKNILIPISACIETYSG